MKIVENIQTKSRNNEVNSKINWKPIQKEQELNTCPEKESALKTTSADIRGRQITCAM